MLGVTLDQYLMELPSTHMNSSNIDIADNCRFPNGVQILCQKLSLNCSIPPFPPRDRVVSPVDGSCTISSILPHWGWKSIKIQRIPGKVIQGSNAVLFIQSA